jgi:hypothetical protein
MIKRLGDAIKEAITERPANGVCILSATCEHCGDAFETIQRNGYRGSDVCTQPKMRGGKKRVVADAASA